jgi:hypothetical protein
MAETNPPLPKSGGSGPIIIAAVLMLLLIGGLIVWKVTGSSDDTPKPVATTTPEPTGTPALDEPPPPPPPPPPPEESAKPVESGQKKVASTGGGGCSKVCEGTASAALQSALAGRGAQARGCYNKALSNNATLQGTMTVSVKVGPGGQVCSASVTNDTLQDPMVKSCVTTHFRASQLPAPEGGCVDVNVPLRFTSKQ